MTEIDLLSESYRAGQYADCDTDVTAWTSGPHVFTEDAKGQTFEWHFGSTQPMWVRVANNVGTAEICVGIVDGSTIPGTSQNRDRVLVSVNLAPPTDLGHAHGAHAVEVAAYEDGFLAWAVVDSTHIVEWRWQHGEWTSHGQEVIPQTSYGLWHWQPGWPRPQLTDHARDATSGVRYGFVCEALTVGQRLPQDGPDALINVWDGLRYVAGQELFYEPRAARDSNGTYRLTSPERDRHRIIEWRGVPPFGPLETATTPPVEPPIEPPPTGLKPPRITNMVATSEIMPNTPVVCLEWEDPPNGQSFVVEIDERLSWRVVHRIEGVGENHTSKFRPVTVVCPEVPVEPPIDPGTEPPIEPLPPEPEPWPPVGLVWPLPGADLVYIDPAWAAEYRRAGFAWVRCNVPVSRDRANAQASVQALRAAGLQVLPILEWPWDEPDVDALCDFAEWYITTFPDSLWISLGNEPWILDHITGTEYLRVALPMSERLEALNPHVRIVYAMDLYDHVSGDERNWPGVDRVIEIIAESPRRWADLHPYRNPYPPEFSPWGSRLDEHDAICDRLGHDRFLYGEMGWKPSEGTKQASGDFHVEELVLASTHGIPLVGVYTHVADLGNPDFDFGLWVTTADDPTKIEPRTAAITVGAYLTDGNYPPVEPPEPEGTLARPAFLAEHRAFPDNATPEQILGYAWSRLVGTDDQLAVEHYSIVEALNYIWPGSTPHPPDWHPQPPTGDVVLTDWLTARWRSGEFMPDYAPLNESDRREFRDALKRKGYNAICVWVAYYYSGGGFNFLERPDEFTRLMREVHDDGLKAIVCIGPEGSGNDDFRHDYPPAKIAEKMRALIQACDPWIHAVMLGPEKEEYWSHDDANTIGRAIREVTGRPIWTHDKGGTVDVDYTWCTGCCYQVIGGNPSTQQVIDELRAAKHAARGKTVLVGETVYGQPSDELEQRAVHLGDTGMRDGGADGSIQAGSPGTVPGAIPPPPNVPDDAIDPNEVQFDTPSSQGARNEVRHWPRTVTLEGVDRADDKLTYTFDEPPWPVVNGVRGNLWVVRNDSGQWRAEPFDYFKPNQRSKSSLDFGWDGWKPKAGESLYALISCTARDKIENGRERSNIVAFRW